jgi:hypothetical protein
MNVDDDDAINGGYADRATNGDNNDDGDDKDEDDI